MSLRSDALKIFRSALKASDPAEAVLRHLQRKGDVLIADGRRYRLHSIDRILVIGAGKASAVMAQAVERLLGDRISGGHLNVKYGHTAKLRRIRLTESGHPVPDQSGLDGAQAMLTLAREAGARDLVICLISGGASALLPLPAPGLSLEDKQGLTQLLLECGANIQEMNCLRKHLSGIKGGRLAAAAHPARVLTLVLSDVIGDKLDVIGSGPTVPDHSTYADAAAILDKYGLWDRASKAVRRRIEQGADETPKPGDPVFARVQNVIAGSNRQAVMAAAAGAKELGYRPLILATGIQGETREVALVHAAIAQEIRATGNPGKPPVCVISGGETTVTIRGTGQGGRNQEFVLAAVAGIAGLKDTVILSAGTDGSDGPTDAAGALADGRSLERASKAGLSAQQYLDNNDSYHFFEALGDLIKTGPTRTNVMDIRLILTK